ncbi:MAG: hydantoinase B/oxoprolinase family protein, partial [Armatimonadota bacterium]|nr:hydantoinase B/oxoprolinase family protein [Armatimonadota bacterium]
MGFGVVDRTDRLFAPEEALPPDRRLARQLERLQEVLSQTGAVAARERAQQAGLLDGEVNLDKLRRVPLIRKEDLPRVQAERWPLGGWVWWERVRRLFVSPGPIFDPEGPGPDYWGCAVALHAAGFRPGDVVVLNDPYLGGTHLPDITMVSPVFVGRRLAGFVACRAHHADVGGMSPGSMPL